MSHLAHVGGLYEAVVCIIAPDALQRDLQNKQNILTNNKSKSTKLKKSSEPNYDVKHAVTKLPVDV